LSYRLQVSSDQASYPILIGAGPWSALTAEISQRFQPTQLIIAMDETVADLYGSAIQHALAGLGRRVSRLVCPAGEAAKSVSVAAAWWEQLATAAVDRQALVVAVGGGVVGDLCGFVAATYLRGLRFVQVPTTLLAQVDSSVGGKVAINLPAGKNLVGCFWQPSLVWIDVHVLATLSDRQFAAGMAEVIKYGVLRDDGLLTSLEQDVASIRARDPERLAALVHQCCGIKADIVQQDPRETNGIRASLNFGHTVGHAIEKLTGYEQVLHGEAVAMGMVAEAELAARLGSGPADLPQRLRTVLHQYDLPTEWPDFPWNQWCGAMLRDKKNVADRIAFALPQRIGQVTLRTDVPLTDVQAIFGK
jgi:3-dehydroquinate synthase